MMPKDASLSESQSKFFFQSDEFLSGISLRRIQKCLLHSIKQFINPSIKKYIKHYINHSIKNSLIASHKTFHKIFHYI